MPAVVYDLPHVLSNHRITVHKQMVAKICVSGQRRFADLFLIQLMKGTVKLVLK